MTEFDWHKQLLPVQGCDSYVSCEELYQAFVARMKSEGWVKQKSRIEECGGQCLQHGLCIAERQNSVCKYAQQRAMGGHSQECRAVMQGGAVFCICGHG